LGKAPIFTGKAIGSNPPRKLLLGTYLTAQGSAIEECKSRKPVIWLHLIANLEEAD